MDDVEVPLEVVAIVPSIDTRAGLPSLRGMMGIESVPFPLDVREILLRGTCFGVDTDNGLAGPLSTPAIVVVESVHRSLGVRIIFLSKVSIVEVWLP